MSRRSTLFTSASNQSLVFWLCPVPTLLLGIRFEAVLFDQWADFTVQYIFKTHDVDISMIRTRLPASARLCAA